MRHLRACANSILLRANSPPRVPKLPTLLLTLAADCCSCACLLGGGGFRMRRWCCVCGAEGWAASARNMPREPGCFRCSRYCMHVPATLFFSLTMTEATTARKAGTRGSFHLLSHGAPFWSAGSTGLLCGECPNNWARDGYPELCSRCPNNPASAVTAAPLALAEHTSLHWGECGQRRRQAFSSGDT